MNATSWRQAMLVLGTDAADLRMFAHVALRPEAELDLARAALLIAEAEYAGLDVAGYAERIDELGTEAACLLAAGAEQPPVMAVVRMLYEQHGFRGPDDEIADARQCYLNELLDRRVGSPVALTILLVEVLRRAGVAAQPVPFAGRILVRVPGAERRSASDRQMLSPAMVDATEGRFLAHGDLTELYRRSTHSEEPMDIGALSAASKRDLLLALLYELRIAHQNRGDGRRLRTVLLQAAILEPGALLGEPHVPGLN